MYALGVPAAERDGLALAQSVDVRDPVTFQSQAALRDRGVTSATRSEIRYRERAGRDATASLSALIEQRSKDPTARMPPPVESPPALSRSSHPRA